MTAGLQSRTVRHARARRRYRAPRYSNRACGRQTFHRPRLGIAQDHGSPTKLMPAITPWMTP